MRVFQKELTDSEFEKEIGKIRAQCAASRKAQLIIFRICAIECLRRNQRSKLNILTHVFYPDGGFEHELMLKLISDLLKLGSSRYTAFGIVEPLMRMFDRFSPDVLGYETCLVEVLRHCQVHQLPSGHYEKLLRLGDGENKVANSMVRYGMHNYNFASPEVRQIIASLQTNPQPAFRLLCTIPPTSHNLIPQLGLLKQAVSAQQYRNILTGPTQTFLIRNLVRHANAKKPFSHKEHFMYSATIANVLQHLHAVDHVPIRRGAVAEAVVYLHSIGCIRAADALVKFHGHSSLPENAIVEILTTPPPPPTRQLDTLPLYSGMLRLTPYQMKRRQARFSKDQIDFLMGLHCPTRLHPRLITRIASLDPHALPRCFQSLSTSTPPSTATSLAYIESLIHARLFTDLQLHMRHSCDFSNPTLLAKSLQWLLAGHKCQAQKETVYLLLQLSYQQNGALNADAIDKMYKDEDFLPLIHSIALTLKT